MTIGRVAPFDALAIARGELYGLLVSSRHWRWAQGQTSERAMREGAEALARVRLGPAAEPVPTRAGLDALLIEIAHHIQEEVPKGEGTVDDVDRIARLWRYALTPFLRPYVARERPGSDFRGPFDELVRDLVELTLRELGHARITAPPFGGRPAGEWIKELRKRRERLFSVIENRKRSVPETGTAS